MSPLRLTAEQTVDLSNAVAHLPEPDRQAFLIALCDLFKDRTEIGDGEMARAVRSLWASGFFKPEALPNPCSAPKPWPRAKVTAKASW
jgi:hypothetical protein